VGIALGTFLIFSVASQAAAVSIVVQDTTVEFISAASILHTFYNSQAGFASSLLPDASLVTGLDLSGVDLFVGYVPSGAYAGTEIASLSAFLAGGSAILFMGESGNPFFDPTNDRLDTPQTGHSFVSACPIVASYGLFLQALCAVPSPLAL